MDCKIVMANVRERLNEFLDISCIYLSWGSYAELMLKFGSINYEERVHASSMPNDRAYCLCYKAPASVKELMNNTNHDWP